MAMNERESTFWKLAPILFWTFYVIFLLSSVPHVTEWYRHLDGAASGITDLLYWALAAGKAIAIDGADVLLTLAFLRLVTEIKGGGDIVKLVIVVLCICGFTAYSWHINWQYEVQFATNEFAKADALMFWGNTPIRVTNPLMGSAFQLFALVFTLISDVVLKQTQEKTAAELEAQAHELEGRARAKQRIARITRENNISNATALIDAGAQIFGHFKNRIQAEKPSVTVEESKNPSEENSEEWKRETEEETQPIGKGNAVTSSAETSEKPEWQHEQTAEENLLAMHYANARSWLMASGSTVPLKTVAETMNLSMKLLNNRVAKKRIRATKNKGIVYKRSVVTWAIDELLPKESATILHFKAQSNAETYGRESETHQGG
jgi:hypothetical protein